MGNLTKNFDREEFACQGENCCDHSAPISPVQITGLQKLRTLIGLPLKVKSGFRCKKHNKEVGGAEDSFHCKAEATDLGTPTGYTVDLFAEKAEMITEFKNGGIIKYDWGIHVDCRGKKYREDRRSKK